MPELKHEVTGRTVTLGADSADRYRALGWVDFTPVGATDEGPSSKWRVAELEAYADEHGIDLAGATSKLDKLALILAAGEDSDDESDADDSETAAVSDPEPAEGEAADAR